MALDLIEELDVLVDALAEEGVDYAVCGAIALAIHGHTRATQDIDLLVRGEDVSRALEVARRVGFDIPARRMTFAAGKPSQREVQRVSKMDPETNELMSLDLVFVTPALEAVWTGRLSVQWRHRGIGVVSREGLATMKRIAGRPQDLVDLAKLEGTDDDDDL